MFTGIFIDDDERDFKYAESMSIAGDPGLSISILRPDIAFVEIADHIRREKPDLLALDFRLDEVLLGDAPNRYKAGPLAQLLRDYATESPADDFPIILVSHEQKVRDFYNPDLTSHDLFDRIYEKEYLGRSGTQKEIMSLITGYKKIIQFIGKDGLLVNLLDLNPEYCHAINEQFIIDISQFRAPHQVSRYVLKNIIDRVGVLLDINSVLAKLGLNHASTDIEQLKEVLRHNKIHYTGAFSEGWERWWAFRLDDFGQSLCGVSLGDLTAEEKVNCLKGKLKLELKPATSRWTNASSAYFAFACASCNMPTELDFSVEAYDPLPFDFIEKKRVCWKCLQTGEYKEKNLKVSQNDRFIANKVENGQISEESEE
ncbi:MAG TPA: hypothetical protein DIW31_03110 [Bacteroidales bacterium]|nr:hypothetical protein [Bacteroidales bacterium]